MCNCFLLRVEAIISLRTFAMSVWWGAIPDLPPDHYYEVGFLSQSIEPVLVKNVIRTLQGVRM